MMAIIAIVNQKGGVGKTTTAVTLGHGLALRGKRALVVDLDSQGNVADSLGLEKTDGLYRLIAYNVGKQAITPSGRPRLDVILSDKNTVRAKRNINERDFREYALREALASVADDYDVIFLDAAPGVDVLQLNSLVAATHFIVPVGLDHLAVVGAGDALASAASLGKIGALTGQFLGVLPTMWERTTKESHQQLETLVSQFRQLVWSPIPRDTKAREAPGYGKTLWEYAPGSRALAGVAVNGKQIGGYQAVTDRLLKEVLS
jgi:chromosome partitioning protein